MLKKYSNIRIQYSSKGSGIKTDMFSGSNNFLRCLLECEWYRISGEKLVIGITKLSCASTEKLDGFEKKK